MSNSTVIASVVGAIVGGVVVLAVDKSGVLDQYFEPDPPPPAVCRRTATDLDPGDPTPSADAFVLFGAEDEAQDGGTVKFDLCFDPSEVASSSFFYVGATRGQTTIYPATYDSSTRVVTAAPIDAVRTKVDLDCTTGAWMITRSDGSPQEFEFDESDCLKWNL